jgi:hypothetical protein
MFPRQLMLVEDHLRFLEGTRGGGTVAVLTEQVSHGVKIDGDLEVLITQRLAVDRQGDAVE